MSSNSSLVLQGWYTQLTEFMEAKKDPRTSDWFLMNGFSPIFTLLLVYNLFCLQLGPRLMKGKEPFELRRVLIAYNALNVLGSLYTFYVAYVYAWSKYNFWCEPVDYSNDPNALKVASAVHFYFLSKVIELMDTVFFVLRNKWNQITFLHLFHHSLMPVVAWIGARYVPGGHGTFLGLLNSVVHIVMYLYYMLAAMGPQYQKYLWWKKYLTQMQLVQFLMIFVHQIPQYFIPCNYPKVFVVLLTTLSAFFVYLFGSFYVHTYLRSGKRAKSE